MPPLASMSASAQRKALAEGLKHQKGRRFAEAQRRYQEVLKGNPDNPDALNLMGTLALEARQPQDAARLFGAASGLVPASVVYLTNLGLALFALKNFAGASTVFGKVLALDPKSVDALCHLGAVEKALNRTESARQLFEQAVSLAPRTSRAVLGLADTLTAAGDMDGATRLCREVIAAEPDNAAAFVALAAAHRFTENDPEPAAMASLGRRLAQQGRGYPAFLHAAGKASADLGRHDEAFEHFAAAKALTSRDFDLGDYVRRHDEVIRLFTPEFFADRAGYGVPDTSPVFIVGMPRSGTTLVEQICSSHSAVSGAGELASIGQIARELGASERDPAVFSTLVKRMTAGQSREIAGLYLKQLRLAGGAATHITDKMPHNFEQLGLIALLFPNAHIIHCTRDPIDNCVSCFTHHFNENHGYNTDLAVLGQYYREYRRLMAHWREVLPIRMLDFSYEALIADQEGRSRELIDFLGLEWEDACLDFHRNERLVKTPSRWQVRQPIYASSVKAWKKYEKHLGPLFESLGDLAIR